jgi:hypothetical protein
LQQAEVTRTRSLAKLKAEKARNASIEKARKLNEESLLRKKAVVHKPKNVSKRQQELIYRYLGVRPTDSGQPQVKEAFIPVKAGTSVGSGDSKEVSALAARPNKPSEDASIAAKVIPAATIEPSAAGAHKTEPHAASEEGGDSVVAYSRLTSTTLKHAYSQRLLIPGSSPQTPTIRNGQTVMPWAHSSLLRSSGGNVGAASGDTRLNMDLLFALSQAENCKELSADIWDEIIESVILISSSRDSSNIKAFLKAEKGIAATTDDAVTVAVGAKKGNQLTIGTPTLGNKAPIKMEKGTAATPRFVFLTLAPAPKDTS